MSDDAITGLHRRFDKLETNFESVQAEQHNITKGLDHVNHRIDLVEMQIDASHKREAMIVNSINEKLAESSILTKKLFDKFDQHTVDENNDRIAAITASKKQIWWLAGTVISVLSSIGMIMFTKVFGA